MVTTAYCLLQRGLAQRPAAVNPGSMNWDIIERWLTLEHGGPSRLI